MKEETITPELKEEIKFNNYKIGYSVAGDKNDVMIVIGSHLYYPRTFSKDLLLFFKIYFIDHVGFSKLSDNTVQKDDLEIISLVNTLEYIRKELNLTKFTLVGHSGHAYIALEYAKKYPEYVTHLLLIAFSPNLSELSHKKSDEYFEFYADTKRKKSYQDSMSHLKSDLDLYPEKGFICMMKRMNARVWYDYNFNSNSLWEGIDVNMPAIDYIWGKVFRDIDITLNLDNFNVKTMLVLGRYDFLLPPPEDWLPLLPLFKNIRMHILDHCAHNPQWEESKIFNQLVLGWIYDK